MAAVQLLENKYITVEAYLRKLSIPDGDLDSVDHCYSKHWNSHPDAERTKPARFLFTSGSHKFQNDKHSEDMDEEVDIESEDVPFMSPFDTPKSRLMTREIERSVKYTGLFSDIDREDIEKHLDSFTPKQRKLYETVTEVLDSDLLAKNSFVHSHNEALKRQLTTEKSANQMRQIFGLLRWDLSLVGWVHRILLKHADTTTLSNYADILQQLRIKIPDLVDRLLNSCADIPEGNAFIQLLKKPYDCILPILNQNKLIRIPGNAILLMCPHAPDPSIFQSPRMRFWYSQMGAMCKVITVTVSPADQTNLKEMLELSVMTVRNKVKELKTANPTRPVILFGFNIAALMACHISLLEQVDGVICMGFPLVGINGSRGDLEDPLLNVSVPVLFVIGQCSAMSTVDNIEDFRSRMDAQTGLVIVGGCDDMIRMSPEKMRQAQANQSIVDRCIVDEIYKFIRTSVVKVPVSQANAVTENKSSSYVKSRYIHVPVKDYPEKSRNVVVEGKRKRKRRREYSPEIPTVKKRQKNSRQQIPTPPVSRSRHHSSSNSSDSDSSTEKPIKLKIIKTPVPKKTNKPPSTPRSPSTFPKPEDVKNKENQEDKKIQPDIEGPPRNRNHEKVLPFSKSILPQKDHPVDVASAFGNDSSFLPTPVITPDYMEQDSAPPESMDTTQGGNEAVDQPQVLSEASTSTPEHASAADQPAADPNNAPSTAAQTESSKIVLLPNAKLNVQKKQQGFSVVSRGQANKPKRAVITSTSDGKLVLVEDNSEQKKHHEVVPQDSQHKKFIMTVKPSAVSRVETVAERVEKELAIQALHQSFGDDAVSEKPKPVMPKPIVSSVPEYPKFYTGLESIISPQAVIRHNYPTSISDNHTRAEKTIIGDKTVAGSSSSSLPLRFLSTAEKLRKSLTSYTAEPPRRGRKPSNFSETAKVPFKLPASKLTITSIPPASDAVGNESYIASKEGRSTTSSLKLTSSAFVKDITPGTSLPTRITFADLKKGSKQLSLKDLKGADERFLIQKFVTTKAEKVATGSQSTPVLSSQSVVLTAVSSASKSSPGTKPMFFSTVKPLTLNPNASIAVTTKSSDLSSVQMKGKQFTSLQSVKVTDGSVTSLLSQLKPGLTITQSGTKSIVKTPGSTTTTIPVKNLRCLKIIKPSQTVTLAKLGPKEDGKTEDNVELKVKKSTGYSICFTNPDGTVTTHPVLQQQEAEK